MANGCKIRGSNVDAKKGVHFCVMESNNPGEAYGEWIKKVASVKQIKFKKRKNTKNNAYMVKAKSASGQKVSAIISKKNAEKARKFIKK